MAALTEAQLAAARVELGTVIDEDDLQERFDRTADLSAAVAEVLRQRLADLLAAPASFNTPDYGQTTTENIKAIQSQLDRLASSSLTVAGPSVVQLVQPRPTGYAR